jgi:hypothetical protein
MVSGGIDLATYQVETYPQSMNTKAVASIEAELDSEESLAEIRKYLRQIDAVRAEMKKTDAEIRRLKVLTRKKLDKTWEIIRDIQAIR